MDQTSDLDAEFDVILPCKDTDAQSSKDMNFVDYWVNKTVEREILQGIKLRQEKPQYYPKELQYENIVNINYIKPCAGSKRKRKPRNKINGIETTLPPRSCSLYKRNSPARTFTSVDTKNTSRPITPRIKKSCKKCPTRIAELAIPTKRQCIDTWRNKYDVLPGFMVDRLKQQVLDQRPVVQIQDAIICFKKKRTSTKRSRGHAAKDNQKTEIKYFCAIFGQKIARILNKPLDVTLNSQLEKISKVVTKDLSEILNSQKKISKNNARNQKILSEMANKVTLWLTTVLEESSFKLLEEELRELEEEEGPVLDFIDDLVDSVVKTCEPSLSSSNSLEFYDRKSEALSMEDIAEKVFDKQHENSFQSPDITSNLDTTVSGLIQTNIYDTEESLHKSSIECSINSVSDVSADNLSQTEEIPKDSEYVIADYITKEINNLIDSINNKNLPDIKHTENDKELDEDFNNSKYNSGPNQPFHLKSQSKNDTNEFNKTPIEDTTHDDIEENKNKRSQDWKSMEPDLVEDNLKGLELQTKNGKDEHNNFNEYQPKYSVEIKDNNQFERLETQDINKEYHKEKQDKDVNRTKPNIIQDSLIDTELEPKSDKGEHMNDNDFPTRDNIGIKNHNQVSNYEIKENEKEHYKDEHVEESYVSTPNIIPDTMKDVEFKTKHDKDEHNNFNEYEPKDNVENKDHNQINDYENKDNKKAHYKDEHDVLTYEDSYVSTPSIIPDTIKDIELKPKSDKYEHNNFDGYQAKDNIETKENNQLNNNRILNDKKEHYKEENASNIAQDQPLDTRLQTDSEKNNYIHINEIQTTDNIEIQNEFDNEDIQDPKNTFFDIEDIQDHNQGSEGGGKQLQDVDTDVQNDKLNVSGIFQIFSEESADEKNKKVKFSNTNIVTHGAPMQRKTNSDIHLLEDNNHNDAERVLWKPTIANIAFAEANNNLLMNLDESWPADITFPVLKPSESVSRSITSLGKILETDEKVSSPEPEDNISIIDNPEHIESGPNALEEHGTEGSQNNISIYSSLEIVELDENTSELYITHELDIICKVRSDDRNESINHADNNNVSKLLEDRVIDVLKLKEPDIIQNNTLEKVITKKCEDTRKIKTNTIDKTEQRLKNLTLKHTTQTAFKSKKLPIRKHKHEIVVTEQDDDRDSKINNKQFKHQEIVEEIQNISCPTPERKLDYKVCPETAPAWVTRARGEPCEKSLERKCKNKLIQEDKAYDIRKLCRDLEQGFINLEAWNDWILYTCNNFKLLQQKRDFLLATKSRGKYLKYWYKLKKSIDKEATLWTKLNRCMQQRMNCHNNKDINESKITSNEYCKMCMGKSYANNNKQEQSFCN